MMEAAFVATEGDIWRRRLLTILFMRCDYADEMKPAIDWQRRADAMLSAAVDRIFALAAARGQLAAPWQPQKAAMAFLLLVAGLVQAWLRAPENLRLTEEGTALTRTFLASLGDSAQGALPGIRSSEWMGCRPGERFAA
jgi:hypothetical protein